MLVVSCTPQKRLTRLLKKHPELAVTTIDTLSIDTFIRVPSKKTNLVIPTQINDSVVFNQDGFKVTLYPIGKTDTIKKLNQLGLKIETKADSVQFKKKLPYERQVITPVVEEKHYYLEIIIAFAILLLMLILIIAIKK
jgi:hypothetical protein